MKIFRKTSIIALAALALTTGFASCSEDDLDTNQYGKSGVNILGFGPMPITRGETMRVTGTQLNKVREVLFPEGNQKLSPATTYINGDFSVQNSEEMTVTIPDQCVPGHLRLVTTNGDTIVSAANISFAEEIRVSSYSPTSAHPGDVVSIKGEYVWNIGQVVFFDHVTVDAENFVKNTRNEIQVIVPAEAKTGELAYNDGSDGGENEVIGNFGVDAIAATGVSNATPEFGETITITGENLDLVTSVDFPIFSDQPFTVAADGKSLTVSVPETAVSGTITLNSASGIIATVDYTVPLASFEAVAPAKDVKAGMTITITGQNLDRVVQVVLPGVETPLKHGEFTQTATQITFVVPDDMTDGKVKLIQHENWIIDGGAIMMYSEAPEEVIWVGSTTIGNWDGSMGDLSWGGYDWSTVQPGQVLSIYLTPDLSNGWSQIRVGNGSWAALPGTSDVNDLTAEDTKFTVALTQEMINELVTNGGLVLCGAYFTVTKVTLSVLETVLWKGELGPTNWNGDMSIPVTDDIKAELQAGKKMGIEFRCDAEGGQVEICGTWWTGLEGPKLVYGTDGDGRAIMNFPGDATSFEWTLLQEDIDILTTQGGILFVGNGGLVITKWYIK